MANGSEMETLSEAMRRLQAEGYGGNWYASDDGLLVCHACKLEFDPATALVDEVVRFEGPSDPGDMAILYALRGPDGHQGLYSAPYGARMPIGDVRAVRALNEAQANN